MRMPAWPIDVARIMAGPTYRRPSRRWRQATGGSVYCWPLRETCSVHADPSQ